MRRYHARISFFVTCLDKQKSKYKYFNKEFFLFFCLDAKEPKDQGKPEGSARFAMPAHTLRSLFYIFFSVRSGSPE